MSEEKKTSGRHGSIKSWIAISVCFLIMLVGIIFYVTTRSQDGVQKRTVTYTDLGFDTPISFQASASEEDFETYAKLLQSLYLGYNALFDQYHAYEGINNVYTLNQEAADHPVEVEDALIDVIKLGIEQGEINSKLDITEGALLTLWHDARLSDTPYVPDAADIEAAAEHTGVEGIVIDEEAGTVFFSDPSIQLDLGAIAKGYTTQVVAEQLEAAGLENGYINAGGNVVLIGEKEDGSDWVIGIQSPANTGSVVQFSTLKPVSIVTSGDYQRYMEVDGVRYSHIIDPDTGYPPEYVRSVSVITTDSGRADALSTALFCMSVEDGMAFASDQGVECIWIVDTGTKVEGASPLYQTEEFDIYTTPGIAQNVNLS